ncbi:hypothetical protein SAMN05878482_10894 [Peribacillus simplex]|uniref:N-terminal Ras-GEF domain-containing protein n=2 Tax=Peribacillus simplex TaxID=1478 RepID=A0A9X8RDA1_9BACI|nr:hypothetical protein SAMN05878482_10894 [Peribacillus simplex]
MKIISSLPVCLQKGVWNGLIPNDEFKTRFLLFYETFTRVKKFATLLPNNWLAKTPQTLALMRLGRQSAEREWISEINSNFFMEKTVGKLIFY